MSNTARRNRRIVIAVIGVIAALSAVMLQVTPIFGTLLGLRNQQSDSATTTPTTTKPVPTIKPLPVRPVVSAFVTTPEQCPAPGPAAPDQPLRICDITRKAVYELGPEAVRLQLTDVDTYRNPLTNTEVVQMAMTAESATQFQQFTASRVGQQVAFVRAGTVVWGPKISAPIDGQVLQLSGEMSPELAKEITRMLRAES